MTKIDKDNVSPEFKLECLKAALATVYFPYSAKSPGEIGVYGDKNLREVFDRSDRILNYCLGDDVPSSLVEKLRSVLCEKS